MRLDKYLKVSRLIKRRTVANDACDGQRIMVNGRTAKASYDVKVGDVIEIAFGQRTVKVEVLAVTENAKKTTLRPCTASSPNKAHKKPPLRMSGAAVLLFARFRSCIW